MNEKTTTFTSAYAYHHPASYDKDVIQSTILLSDKAIDVKKIKAAGGDFDKALHAWLDEGKVAYWEAIFYPDGEYWSGQAISPGVYAFYNRIGCKLTMTRNDAKGIEGACRTEDEKEKENHDGGLYVDIKFAAGL
ncbi:MAG: hypothetical protein E6K53_03400 [Gammaproteobacteria bacterium]|nr:MAG: hypothetical protein E6K53_03400 [Gammaproteobacteria bacterium]